MSAAVESENEDMPMQLCAMHCCASCGIAEIDDIKLKDCDGCDLVKYCSDACQEDHISEHKEACKKRGELLELRDKFLFKQPESTHSGDCPICCLPIPIEIDQSKSRFYTCCSKLICKGCNVANMKREYEGRLQQKCPFCRNALPDTEEEADAQTMKRIEANDPAAICHMGTKRYNEGDYEAAFEFYTKAAALEDVHAHFQLSTMYFYGKGVEQDDKRAMYYAEMAAILGHPIARHNLGCTEERENDRLDRAAKHWIIAAKLGNDMSLERIKDLYKDGHVSKDDFTAALRGYQTAIEATKSPQRKEAEKFAQWLADRRA